MKQIVKLQAVLLLAYLPMQERVCQQVPFTTLELMLIIVQVEAILQFHHLLHHPSLLMDRTVPAVLNALQVIVT